MKLAIMIPNWVGDACMATPTLRALRHGLAPETSICWVGRPAPMGVLEGLDWADERLIYKPRSRTVLNRRQLVRELRSRRLDAIVYLTNSFSTGLIGWLAGIPRRVGYARDWRGWMLTDSIPTKTSSYDVDKSSCIENYLRLADAMACDSSDRRTELGLTDKDRTMAEECLHAIGLPVDRPLIVLNTGAATAPTKRWPIEHAATTARRLAEELGASIVIHAGPNERETAAALEASSAHPFVRSMGRYRDLPLGLSKGLIARSYLVVSTDSGPRHIGVAFNKPVVSLFGSIDPAATQTFNRPETIVRLGLACQPCGSYDCRWKHADCMNKLDSERVVRAVKAAIAGSNLRFLERSELGTLVP